MKHLLLLANVALISLQLMGRNAFAQSEDTRLPTGTSSQTRTLFRKGLASYNAGQVETARQLFLTAWAIQPSADVAMELAQTEMDLGKYVDAAEHLDYALRNFTPSINEKMRSIARQAYTDVLRRVAKLNVTVNQDGAEVLLNSRVVGKTPLPGSLYTEAGSYVVQARRGNSSASESLLAEPGKEMPVILALQPAGGTASDLRTEQEPHHEPLLTSAATHKSLVPVIVGGAVTILGLATGLGLRIASDSEANNAQRISSRLGIEGCTGTNANASTCTALRDSLSKSDRERNWSTAGFVVGSAAILSTAVYWFWPRKQDAAAASGFHVSGTLSANSGGVAVVGAF
jgi:hypothetical protein